MGATAMIRQTLGVQFCLLFAVSLFSQQTPSTSTAPAMQQFPVLLEQSVVAGKTPVGTKIQSKLTAATLVAGTVIPKNAVLSGEVIESVAKTKNDPSRLSLRMDSAQWKTGSASLKLYLTRWYYPTKEAEGQDLQYGAPVPPNRTWNGMGQYPDANNPAYRPFPSADSEKAKSSVPDTPAAVTSNHPTLMKNVDSVRKDDGSLEIVSAHSSIKLDKLTTYVLATDDLPSESKK
jgi:hypothetical protein